MRRQFIETDKVRFLDHIMTPSEIKQRFNSKQNRIQLFKTLSSRLGQDLTEADIKKIINYQNTFYDVYTSNLPLVAFSELNSVFLENAFKRMSSTITKRKIAQQKRLTRKAENFEQQTNQINKRAQIVTAKGSNNLFNRDIDDQSFLRRDQLPEYVVAVCDIPIESFRRNPITHPNPSNYTFALLDQPDQEKKGEIRGLPKLRSIISVELIRATLPNIINSSGDYIDPPYIYLKIPEIEGEVFTGNSILTKSFATISFNNYRKKIARSVLLSDDLIRIKKWPVTSSLSNLNTITIQIYDRFGEFYLFDDDYVTLNDTPFVDITIVGYTGPPQVLTDFNTFTIKFTSSSAHNLNTNDKVFFTNVSTSFLMFDAIVPANSYESPKALNKIINRESGFIVTVISATEFEVTVVMDDNIFANYDPIPPNNELMRISSTESGYIIKEKNQNTFQFRVHYLI